MPVYFQPTRLTDLCLTSIKVLLKLLLQEFLKAGSWENVSQTGRQLQQHIAHHIRVALDKKLQADLVSHCMKALCSVMTGHEVPMYQLNLPELSSWQTEVYCNFISLILHQNMFKFDVTNLPNPVRRLVYHCMSSLTGLEELTISRRDMSFVCVRTYAQSESEISCYLEESLKNLTNLKKVIHKYSSDDKIVKLLSETAPNLKYLDVSLSSGITSASLSYILQMKHLEEILLNGCSLSSKKMLAFLHNIPQYFDNEGDRVNSLGLDKVTKKIVSTFMKSCPNITKICIGSCEFIELIQVFRKNGYNLHEISLSQVSDVDLEVIGQNSKVLRTLILKDCTFVKYSELNSEAFIALEMCDLVLNCLEDAEVILWNCKDLKVMQLTCLNTNLETPFIMQRILANNQFTKLRKVKLDISDQTIAAANCFFSGQSNIEMLIISGSWGIIQEDDIIDFRNNVKTVSPGIVITTQGSLDDEF